MLHLHGRNTVALWNNVKISKIINLNKHEVRQKSNVTTTAYNGKCTLINIFMHHKFIYVKSQQHSSVKGTFSEFLLLRVLFSHFWICVLTCMATRLTYLFPFFASKISITGNTTFFHVDSLGVSMETDTKSLHAQPSQYVREHSHSQDHYFSRLRALCKVISVGPPIIYHGQ
jgi:hypothetical protein